MLRNKIILGVVILIILGLSLGLGLGLRNTTTLTLLESPNIVYPTSSEAYGVGEFELRDGSYFS